MAEAHMGYEDIIKILHEAYRYQSPITIAYGMSEIGEDIYFPGIVKEIHIGDDGQVEILGYSRATTNRSSTEL